MPDFNSLPTFLQFRAIMDARNQALARQQAGGVLYDIMNRQQQGAPQVQAPPMPPAMPPMPPQAAPAPGSMSPGGGNPQVMPPTPGGPQPGMAGPGPQGQPRMMAPPPPVQPFKPMPSAPAANDQTAGIPPPPAAQPAAPAPAQRPFDLKNIVGALQRAGVPSTKAMDMLDALSPAMTAENKMELESYKLQNAALNAANIAYARIINAGAAVQRAGTGAKAEDRRERQGEEKIQIARDKEARLRKAGEGLKLKSTEIIYAKNPDGTPDTSSPIGVRGTTPTGRLISVDTAGHQVQSLDGVSAKEAKGSKGAQQAATRNKLVTGSAQNALRMLGEIKTKYPKDTTSILMTTHPEGLFESAATGMIRAGQTKHQQNVDTAWKSFIDEAIPVFTGGLRGSDAFRRFLTSQVPLMGAKNNEEIMRLFENNIKGIDRTFANQMLTAYASDPKYWGTRADGKPVTKADVDAALAAAQGGGAASQQGEWKVEKVGQ